MNIYYENETGKILEYKGVIDRNGYKKYEKYIYCVQIKWFNFFDHIIWHMNDLVMGNKKV